MRFVKWSVFACALILSARFAAVAAAQSSHLEEFSNDQDPVGDQFEPATRTPLSEALGGLPPVDWNDIRNGWVGVVEEEAVIDALKPGPDPGAATVEYGIVQHEAGTGPYWSPTSFDDNPTLTLSVDVYADPVIVTNGASPDFWWTSAVGPGGGYATESGFTADAGIGTWLFSTTGGIPIATVAVGAWYEMDITYTQGIDGTLDATHTLYDATGIIPLGSVTVTTLFLDPVNTPIAPSYSWFTFFGSNVDSIFIDDFHVVGVPEPSTFIMGGLGAVGMVFAAARRRRRA